MGRGVLRIGLINNLYLNAIGVARQAVYPAILAVLKIQPRHSLRAALRPIGNRVYLTRLHVPFQLDSMKCAGSQEFGFRMQILV